MARIPYQKMAGIDRFGSAVHEVFLLIVDPAEALIIKHKYEAGYFAVFLHFDRYQIISYKSNHFLQILILNKVSSNKLY